MRASISHLDIAMRIIDPSLVLAVIANEDANTARRSRVTPTAPLPAVEPEPDSWEDEVTEELPMRHGRAATGASV